MEKLEMQSCEPEERTSNGGGGAAIVQYDHEPRSPQSSGRTTCHADKTQLLKSEAICLSEKGDKEPFPRSLFIGNGEPPVVAKAAVCVIAFIVAVVCLCFLFIRY